MKAKLIVEGKEFDINLTLYFTNINTVYEVIK